VYGDVDNIRKLIKQIPDLSPKEAAFVETVFNLEKAMKCDARRLPGEKLVNASWNFSLFC